MKTLPTTAACVLLSTLLGCEDKPAEPTPTQPSTSVGKRPDAPLPVKPTKLEWTKPEAWKEVDHPSRMRKATYAIPKAEGDAEDGEMSVTQIGGTVDLNVQRWQGQFQGSPEAKTNEKVAHGLKVTVVEIEGTFTASGGGPMMGKPGEPKEGWKLLAAIADTRPATFFKLTGPKKTVDAARGDFDALVDSITPIARPKLPPEPPSQRAPSQRAPSQRSPSQRPSPSASAQPGQ